MAVPFFLVVDTHLILEHDNDYHHNVQCLHAEDDILSYIFYHLLVLYNLFCHLISHPFLDLDNSLEINYLDSLEKFNQ